MGLPLRALSLLRVGRRRPPAHAAAPRHQAPSTAEPRDPLGLRAAAASAAPGVPPAPAEPPIPRPARSRRRAPARPALLVVSSSGSTRRLLTRLCPLRSAVGAWGLRACLRCAGSGMTSRWCSRGDSEGVR